MTPEQMAEEQRLVDELRALAAEHLGFQRIADEFGAPIDEVRANLERAVREARGLRPARP